MSSTPEVTAKVDKKTKKEKELKEDKKDKEDKKEKKAKSEKSEKVKLKDLKESPSGSFIGKDDKKDKSETRERGLSKADRTKSPKPARRHSVNKSVNREEDGETKTLKRTPSFGLLEKKKLCPELDRDDVNFEFTFFDSSDTITLKDDDRNPFIHWENILQAGGARVLDSFTKPSQSLNNLVRQYFREVGESKIELLKWIANNHLRGSKQAYLNYLCDHCSFQLKLVEKNAKPDGEITNATHGHLRRDSGGSGHRRSRSVGVAMLSTPVDDEDISRPLSRSEEESVSGSLGYSSGSHGSSSSSKEGTEDDSDVSLSTSPTTYAMMQKRKTIVGSSAPFITNPALAAQRKTKSVAVRSNSKVRPSIKNATFANNNSNRFANINDEDPNNNNSQKALSKSETNLNAAASAAKPPIIISPPSRTQSKRQLSTTTDPKKADLRAILESLIKHERIQEAMECKKYVEILDKLQARQAQYEAAKQEDRLHEAIAIRNEVNELMKDYDNLTSAMIAHWIQQEVEGHVTLQEMHELLIDKVGTAKALPFIEEFANANIQSFPPEDLEKALEIQQKAKLRLKEFQVTEVDEQEKERRRKEEEERWKKEAEERRAQKKKKKSELATIIKQNSNEKLTSVTEPVMLFDNTEEN
mmetsp:Transcript_19202/g.26883  ORF Transcript_19202/g.26883 Transcript_19202/m.26883 type:complete len:642 (-) Transcript_19202:68-1993(-)